MNGQEEDAPRGGAFSRRKALVGVGLLAATGLGVAGCTSSSTGSGIGDPVGTMNDLVNQQQKLTIQAYNKVKDNPECQYPSDLLLTSLELQNQRVRVLRFNEPTKTGWIHCFAANGVLIGTFPVLGKVSSLQSSMTSSTGVFLGTGGNGYPAGDNVPVDMPGDDISFGPNEDGVFWLTPDRVYMTWNGPYMYVDTDLDVKLEPALGYPANAQPTKSAA
jgi:hypothetical protein